jgi:ribosomal protein S18 acetylase RimI-like enzyme
MAQSPAAPVSFVIREMTIADYDAVRALLASVPGVTLRAADSRENTQRYLERNPGLSFVAVAHGRMGAESVVGCLMGGHDGRRGYLQHLAVDAALRRQGIGAALVERSLAALELLRIEKMHIDVLLDNTAAQQFWSRRGWNRRDDVVRYSFSRSSDSNV